MSSSNAVFRRSASVLAFGLTALGAMGVASAQEAGAAVSTAPMPASGGIAGTDHAKVVNHLGFTYLGVQSVPIATNATGGSQNVPAPTVGIRYWLNEGMALDAGIGLAIGSGSEERKSGGTTVTTDKPGIFGAVIHAGLPIVLGTPGKHYKFTLIPEVDIGFASSTVKPPPAPAVGSDLELSGLLIQAGARVGAEIQFGFIGIPELALQGSVGLGVRRVSTTGTQKAFGNTPEASGTNTDLGIGTTVQSAPWGLFTNSVAAIYYF